MKRGTVLVGKVLLGYIQYNTVYIDIIDMYIYIYRERKEILQGFLLETFLQQELTHDKISIQHEDFQIYGLMFLYIYIYDIYDTYKYQYIYIFGDSIHQWNR